MKNFTDEEIKQKAIRFAVDYPTNYGKGYKRIDLRKSYINGFNNCSDEIKKMISDLLVKYETSYNIEYSVIDLLNELRNFVKE